MSSSSSRNSSRPRCSLRANFTYLSSRLCAPVSRGALTVSGGIAPAAVRHVLPDEHPQAVAVVVPAVGLDLHVLAQGVEAHRLGRGDVEGERRVAGRGVEPVGPPALVEQAVHEIGLPVEQQALRAVPVLADADAAQGEIALRPVLAEREDELIEIGVLRRPEADVAELYERALPGGELELLAVYLRAHRALAAAR